MWHDIPLSKSPILATADKCRQLVGAYIIMRDLSDLDAVAQVADQPLTDGDEMFCFRLGLLHFVELEELQVRFGEVERLLDAL